MLTVQNLTYRIAGRILLEDASFALDSGHKAALIGRNGSGKSTLFGLLAGDLQPDGGEIRLQKGVRLGRVAQEAPAGPESLIETVLRADEEREALLAEAETAEDGHRIAEIHTRLADIEAEKAPARAARILAGLGFDEETQQRPCHDFSGGWRMRVALAAALFARPDLLLLDEPTNHLDLEAAIWLEDYLASWPGTLLVISHDRRLLDTIPEEILHLDDRKVTRYVGNYTRFERTRAERQMQQARLAEKQAAERKHIQAFVDRFRAKATKARQAQSRLKMLARMEPIVQVREEAGHEFRFPQPDQLPPPIVAMDNVAVGYEPDKPVLSKLGLRIDMDDRIGLLGANGNGKSTLVKLLAGRLAPQSGQMTVPPKLRVGYFAQHQQEELHLEESAFQQVRRLMPDASETQVRSHLGGFAFSGQSADQAVGSMSGGEKARLLFAMMSLGAPHLMLLDEPTNHLDVDAREALIRALNDYDGAVVLVSHDPHLLELVCDRLWLVRDGSCRPYDGDLDDYRKLLQEERRDRRRRAADERAESDGGDKLSKKDARRARAQNRERTQELRRQIKDAERDIEKLTQKREALEAKLADPAVYDGPTRDLMDLQVKHADLKQRVDDAEARWLEAQAALEELEQAGDSAA